MHFIGGRICYISYCHVYSVCVHKFYSIVLYLSAFVCCCMRIVAVSTRTLVGMASNGNQVTKTGLLQKLVPGSHLNS